MQTTYENYVGTVQFSRFQTAVATARENNHAYWIGDIPVHKELQKFFKALKAKRYNVVPCVDGVNSGFCFKLGITFPDALGFRSGGISIDYGHTDGGFTFAVHSEKIENEKFATHNDGYHIRQSKDMAKALKLALKFLTPLAHDDIQERCDGKLASAVYALNETARDKLYSKLSIERSVIAQEVANMIACAYVPSTTEFQKALDLLVTEGAELRRMQGYKPRACFVWVKPNSLSYKFKEDSRAVECTQMDDVPELIRNKLAVLQIANNGDVIPDVGIRVSDITYWVFA
jgi:hypothetical protein